MIFKLHYWPIFTSTWILLTFLISYAIATLNDHVDPVFPYISDTGTTPPESCIFGQLLNFAALFTFINMYIKYRQVRMSEYADSSVRQWNKWIFYLGILSCLGMSLVANFQETSELTTHFVGAVMVFGLGIIYFMMLTYLSWRVNASKILRYSRLILNIIAIPLYISTMVCSILAFSKIAGISIKWDVNLENYDIHLAATFSEWFIAITMGLYIITFTSEFKTLQFDEIVFIATKYT